MHCKRKDYILHMQKLGEIAEISTGFPFDGHKYTSIGIRVVRGENIGQGELHWEEKVDKRWNGSTSALDNYWLYEGDIVMQMDGNVGKNIARIYTADPMLIAQRVACIRAKEKCSQDYIYGILRTKLFKNYIERCATGTSIKHISLQQISDFEFDFHLPEIQAKLGRIIADIDDKIRVNRQINDNLEAMAKQLYDYWFVQFNFPNEEGKPYKSSGGAMVWNENLKREIPQGWSGVSLKDLALTSRNAITPVENEVYQHFSIPSFDACGSYSLDNGSNIKSDKFVLQKGQLLVSKLNPWFNRVVWVPKGTNMIGSTEFVVLNPNNESESGYIYSVIKSPKFIAYCSQAATGTSHSQRRISPDVLMAFKVVYEQGVVQKYGCLIEKIQKQQTELLSEITMLTKQRDELLPLLMNGQVSVNYHLSAC